MSQMKWLSQHTRRLDGKTVAITGSTGGLGKVLCRFLASLGADLILMDRNLQRSCAHRDALQKQFPHSKVRCLVTELSDMTSVRAACDELLASPIDIFIHNAGAYGITRKKCDSGYENIFQINFVSPYYILRRLLPTLQERGGCAMVVGSIAHFYSQTDPSDVDFSTHPKASYAYGNAKRHLMCAIWELARANCGIPLSVAHPGITVTGITAHYPKWLYALIQYPMKVIFMSNQKATLPLLQGVFEGCAPYEWIGPRFFHIWGLPKKETLSSVSEEECRRIGNLANQIYHSL